MCALGAENWKRADQPGMQPPYARDSTGETLRRPDGTVFWTGDPPLQEIQGQLMIFRSKELVATLPT